MGLSTVFVGMQTAAGQSEEKKLIQQLSPQLLYDALRSLPG
jgi:hypothetical protein